MTYLEEALVEVVAISYFGELGCGHAYCSEIVSVNPQ